MIFSCGGTFRIARKIKGAYGQISHTGDPRGLGTTFKSPSTTKKPEHKVRLIHRGEQAVGRGGFNGEGS